jgi:hypothetical protein
LEDVQKRDEISIKLVCQIDCNQIELESDYSNNSLDAEDVINNQTLSGNHIVLAQSFLQVFWLIHNKDKS